MKITHLILKSKKKNEKFKTKQALFPGAVADQLGNYYDELGESINTLSRDRDKVKDKVKNLAVKHGKKSGKETIISGNIYEVGFQDVEDSKVFDPVLAEKLLDEKTYRNLCRLQIDQKKLEKAVLTGIVSNRLFLKMFVQSRKGSQRIVIRQKKTK